MPAFSPPARPDPFVRRPRVLQCPTCRRTEPRPADSLRRLAQGRWPECCGRVMVPAVEVVAAAAPDATPWADRRLTDRHSPRPGARVALRRGAMGMGPDVAVELLDVSASGARVHVRARVQPGDRVLVALRPPSGAWEAGGPAEVCWCQAEGGGTALAGVRFQHPLFERQVAELAD